MCMKKKATYKWHFYFKGSSNKQAAFRVLHRAVSTAHLKEMSNVNVKVEYVEPLGCTDSAWRAIRLTLVEGPTAGQYLAKQLRAQLCFHKNQNAIFATVKGNDKEMDAAYRET